MLRTFRDGRHRSQADFFSMLSGGRRRGAAGGAEGAARGAAATGPHVAVARELLDLIEFSIGALRRQVSLGLESGRVWNKANGSWDWLGLELNATMSYSPWLRSAPPQTGGTHKSTPYCCVSMTVINCPIRGHLNLCVHLPSD